MKAVLRRYRQSPRKVRLVADLIRGRDVKDALSTLNFLDKKASLPLRRLLDSAIANAKENSELDQENLYIKEVRVDKGITLKRSRPVSRGRTHPINRRSSNISLKLEQKISDPKRKTDKKAKQNK